MKKESVNTFAQGLNYDLNPITTPADVLTDNINGTLVTFNGDELALQNDAGNTKIQIEGTEDWVSLSPRFYPIGMKEFGGVLYIVSARSLDKNIKPIVIGSVYNIDDVVFLSPSHYQCIQENTLINESLLQNSLYWKNLGNYTSAKEKYDKVEIGSYPSPEFSSNIPITLETTIDTLGEEVFLTPGLTYSPGSAVSFEQSFPEGSLQYLSYYQSNSSGYSKVKMLYNLGVYNKLKSSNIEMSELFASQNIAVNGKYYWFQGTNPKFNISNFKGLLFARLDLEQVDLFEVAKVSLNKSATLYSIIIDYKIKSTAKIYFKSFNLQSTFRNANNEIIVTNEDQIFAAPEKSVQMSEFNGLFNLTDIPESYEGLIFHYRIIPTMAYEIDSVETVITDTSDYYKEYLNALTKTGTKTIVNQYELTLFNQDSKYFDLFDPTFISTKESYYYDQPILKGTSSAYELYLTDGQGTYLDNSLIPSGFKFGFKHKDLTSGNIPTGYEFGTYEIVDDYPLIITQNPTLPISTKLLNKAKLTKLNSFDENAKESELIISTSHPIKINDRDLYLYTDSTLNSNIFDSKVYSKSKIISSSELWNESESYSYGDVIYYKPTSKYYISNFVGSNVGNLPNAGVTTYWVDEQTTWPTEYKLKQYDNLFRYKVVSGLSKINLKYVENQTLQQVFNQYELNSTTSTLNLAIVGKIWIDGSIIKLDFLNPDLLQGKFFTCEVTGTGERFFPGPDLGWFPTEVETWRCAFINTGSGFELWQQKYDSGTETYSYFGLLGSTDENWDRIIDVQSIVFKNYTDFTYDTFSNDTYYNISNSSEYVSKHGIILPEHVEISNPVLQLNNITNITSFSANLEASLISDGAQVISEIGFVIDVYTNPDVLDTKIIVPLTYGAYNKVVSGLISKQQYFVKAYCITPGGIFYSNELTFTTLAQVGTSEINLIDDIYDKGAQVEWEVTDSGGETITESGVCWSTETHPTTSLSTKVKQILPTLNVPYSQLITGLQPNTKYYIRSYCINSIGTSYGENTWFTTPLSPVVETHNATGISALSATLNGSVISSGKDSEGIDATIVERGFRVSTVASSVYIGTKYLVSPNQIGSMSYNFVYPNGTITYYYVAFTKNSVGSIAYGEVKSFKAEDVEYNLFIKVHNLGSTTFELPSSLSVSVEGLDLLWSENVDFEYVAPGSSSTYPSDKKIKLGQWYGCGITLESTTHQHEDPLFQIVLQNENGNLISSAEIDYTWNEFKILDDDGQNDIYVTIYLIDIE